MATMAEHKNKSIIKRKIFPKIFGWRRNGISLRTKHVAWPTPLVVLWCIFLPLILFAQEGDPYIHARVKRQKGETDSALVYIDRAIALQPGKAGYYLFRADMYFTKGWIAKAREDYEKANTLEEGSGDYGLARCYAATEEYGKAIQYPRKHLSSSYRLSKKDILTDPAFASMEHTREWKELWQQEWYTPFDYLVSEVQLKIAAREYTEAINQLSYYLKNHSKKHEGYALRARAYYEMKNFRNALSDLNDAIEISGRNAAYYKLRGQVRMALSQYKEAVADYSSSLAIDNSDVELYMLRAEALRLAGQTNEAVRDINTYLLYTGYDEQALYTAALAMYDGGNYLQCLSFINKVIERNKNKASYFLLRGNAYLKTNMARYAIRDYGMALDLDASLTEAWVNKGTARLMTGDKSGACHDWQIAASRGSSQAVMLMQENCL